MNPPDAGSPPRIVPELDVTALAVSLPFYVDVLGFAVSYQREDEGFAYLALDGAELMLQEAAGPGRRFRTAPLERPFGRGINLQIQVPTIQPILDAYLAAGHEPVIDLEDRWYEVGNREEGNRQFVAADPDGYLLRLFEDLGRR